MHWQMKQNSLFCRVCKTSLEKREWSFQWMLFSILMRVLRLEHAIGNINMLNALSNYFIL